MSKSPDDKGGKASSAYSLNLNSGTVGTQHRIKCNYEKMFPTPRRGACEREARGGGGGGAVFISLSPPGGGEDVAVLFILAAV